MPLKCPEQYFLEPNTHCPNNRFPVLLYRDVLPRPHTEESTTKFLEGNGWEKRGTWGHYPTRHFHPNTHECYGIFQSNSTLLLGLGGGSDTNNDTNSNNPSPTLGKKISVQAGDVLVLPAGTGHCCLESSEGYKYVGVYPRGSPKWRNEFGTQPIDIGTLRREIENVEVPDRDPVDGGVDGFLVEVWRDVEGGGWME